MAVAAAASAQKKEGVGKRDNLNDGDGNGDDEDPNKSEINNRFINALSAMNISPLGEDDDDEDDDDPVNNIFQCDWSTRMTDQVLELLLRRLGGDTSSFLVDYGHPVGYGAPCREHANGERVNGGTMFVETDNHHQEKYEESRLVAREASLSCSQHASEILIAIIQNSPLNSPFMLSLSSDPTLQRILDLVMATSSSSSSGIKEPEILAHESIMTCAVTVLESLVLQLGGYGAVAASSSAVTAFGNGTQEAKHDDGGRNVSFSTNSTGPRMTDYDLALHDLPSSSATHPPMPEIANMSTLLRRVTALLARLSELLTHPITRTWVEPAQYSNGQPRLLLGTSRLRILRLVESLVLLGNLDVDAALQSSDCLEKCLDLFWQFEWCSMLHQCIANILVHVFEGGLSRSGLQEYFLVRCNLAGRLMNSFFDVVEDNIIIVPSTSGSGSTDSITGVEGPSKEEGKVFDQLIEEDIAICLPRPPQNDEMTIAVSISSTKGEHHDSQIDYGGIGEDEVDAVAPVSEDDVDSVLEQECQEGIVDALIGTTPEDGEEDGRANPSPELVTDNSSSSTPQGGLPNQTCFRKGYMGHVIIICQALVHACNNSVSHSAGQREDENGVAIKRTEESTLSSPASFDEVSITSSFETSAILAAKAHHHGDEFYCSNSKKRKDRSPVRGGGEDIKRLASSPSSNRGDDLSASPTLLEPEVLSSPVQLKENEDSQSPSNNESDRPRKSTLSIDNILRQHPLFGKWQNFVTSVLASEMSVQSTPLGGQVATNNPNASRPFDGSSDINLIFPSVIHDNFDDDFLGIEEEGPSPFSSSGLFGGLVVGEIDMDENDLDIAASMMEALRVGHNRHRPCFGGSESVGSEKASRGIANFGSVIQQPGGFQDYVYDDPLGHVHLFENGDNNDEDDGNFNGISSNNSDDEGFMSDAMVVSRDGDMTKQHERGSRNIRKSQSNSSDDLDDDDDDDDDDVPVMDLFAGSFDPNFANFDAMASDGDPFDTVEAKNGYINGDMGDDIGHAKTDDPCQFFKHPLDLVDSLKNDSEGTDPMR